MATGRSARCRSRGHPMRGSDGSPSRYRNPPLGHRFPKGAPANPSGRPRKKDNRGRGGQPNIGFEDRIKSVAIEEAYRLVNIRDGDRVERIPLVQAIIRKLGLAAATGNIRAAQSFLNLLIGAEADRRVATNELLKAAAEYKEYCGRVPAAPNGQPG